MEVHGIDWEDAFANAAYIDSGMDYPDRWERDAEAFRLKANAELDLPYGAAPRERFDLFRPASEPRGLAVFVHGGYWLSFDQSSWSHLAEGALSSGWAVALPTYTLAPEARIHEITRSIGRAVTAAAKLVPGPIRLAGHSAGGHLVSRMVCDDTPLDEATADRITRVVSISGLHDLRPLQLHSMNAQLKLDEQEATSESAALRSPRPNTELVAWVGARERPEFLRQSALIAEAWRRKGSRADLVADPGRHHFDVIEGLADPNHPLTRAYIGP
ncbi:alpha/beta hydrolase [Rhizobium vallis]|uniref:Alpha/beta hydrolase n=1 Tax=Rhizobium vallis TaxID=634290 RepID=A0A432PRF0_9HYPH|nr:alpha/beta hydrolase [Rhizobium vallis]RUM27114.1 alpha/beta hydrolase [Rhizobium vallis]